MCYNSQNGRKAERLTACLSCTVHRRTSTNTSKFKNFLLGLRSIACHVQNPATKNVAAHFLATAIVRPRKTCGQELLKTSTRSASTKSGHGHGVAVGSHPATRPHHPLGCVAVAVTGKLFLKTKF
jgi:hypothetical protein